MSERGGASIELRPTNRRLESFSDGVFAIVITIMVLEVAIPNSLAFTYDPGALREFAGALIAYGLSFLVIANLWVSHHYLVFTLSMPARSTIWLNNLLLFTITLIPVATRFIGMFPDSPRAAAAYGTVAFVCTAAFMLLRSHAARNSHNELHRGIHRRILRKTWLFLAIYAASIPLAFLSPWLAWACFISVPPMLFLPVIRIQPVDRYMMENGTLERSCP
jgi:uncharacterized membrane protein